MSASDDFLPSSQGSAGQVSNLRRRPTRAAIIHGKEASHEVLVDLFSPLGVDVFSSSELNQSDFTGLISSASFDVIALVGEPQDFESARRGRSDEDPIVLSFAPTTRFKNKKKYLEISDALVLCNENGKSWELKVSRIIFHFFESLLIPSMLNIDLADVKRIAKGVGLAFNVSEDDQRKIVSMLPDQCLVARSAVLHFSCRDDVRLQEVYSISKSIALKKGIAGVNPVINGHQDAKKIIRKVNVKMGIRIVNNDEYSAFALDGKVDLQCEKADLKRINMTAILFGI